MKVGIVVYPGTNCELDTKYAYEKLNADVDLIWHKNDKFNAKYDLIILPGGFSYGDYLRSGAIAKFSPIMKSIMEYADKGGNILGICNGFQILLEVGLLPGAMKKNKNIHFVSEFHYLKVENNQNIFLQKFKIGDIINIPIAHGEGNYYIDDEELKKIQDNKQILLTYCDEKGNANNPNGSVANIAGICNKNGNIFGLMPHPERAIEEILGSKDGIKMLEGFLK